jgi:drug/metabolite transporter (DMT)-like permease
VSPTVPAVTSAPSLLRGRLLLAASAVMFGSMFVPAQRALEDLTPAGATALRFAVATLAVAPFCAAQLPELRRHRGDYLRAGLIAGTANTAGFLLQSLALERTTASSTAFLSSLFVVFVPLFTAVLARRLPSRWVVGGIGLAVFGSFLLTGASLQVESGDALAVGAAVAGAVHVMTMGWFAPRLAAAPFNVAQLGAVALLAGAIAVVVGVGELTLVAVLCLLYLGLAQAGALGLQVIAQRSVDPTSSALILLLVPVVGAVMAVVLLDDPVSVQRVLGAVLVVAAVLLVEALPSARSSRPGNTAVT